jgi:hypothetical protein
MHEYERASVLVSLIFHFVSEVMGRSMLYILILILLLSLS